MVKTKKEQNKSEEVAIKNPASSVLLKDFFQQIENINYDKLMTNIGKLCFLDIFLCIIFLIILGGFFSVID